MKKPFMLVCVVWAGLPACEQLPPDQAEIVLVKQAIKHAKAGEQASLDALTSNPQIKEDGAEPRAATLNDFVPVCELEDFEVRGDLVVAGGWCRMPEPSQHTWPYGMNFRLENNKIVEIQTVLSEW